MKRGIINRGLIRGIKTLLLGLKSILVRIKRIGGKVGIDSKYI